MWDAVQPPTVVLVILGGLAITAALMVPGVGPWLALGLVAAAAWGYESQFRFDSFRPELDTPPVVLTPDRTPAPPAAVAPPVAVRVALALAATVVLAAPLLIRNRGYVLPPAGPAPHARALMGLALLGWLVFPVLMLAACAHDRSSPLPWRLPLAALARHPVTTLLALLVVPLGLMMIEALLALVAWQQGQLPLLIVDGFPPPRYEMMGDGTHAIFNFDGTVIDLRNVTMSDHLPAVYSSGLRRGFTLLGTIPLSLSVGLLEVRGSPGKFNVLPGYYLATRIFLTLVILAGAGLLLTIQARWLALVAALDSRRPDGKTHAGATLSSQDAR
jgi:hypothetical protein